MTKSRHGGDDGEQPGVRLPKGEPIDNAALNESIRHAAENTSFADRLLAEGRAVVYMDEDGTMVTKRPDGQSGRGHADL